MRKILGLALALTLCRMGWSEEAALSPLVLDATLQSLNASDPKARERALDKLKNTPEMLKAVLAAVETKWDEGLKAYRTGKILSGKVDLAKKVKADFEAHAAQKKVVGSAFVTPANKPDFL